MTTTDPYWNADTLLGAFQRMVRKQDYWRGYVGYEEDAPSDDEVWQWLQAARDALRFEPLGWEDVEIVLRAAVDEDEALEAAGALKNAGYVVGMGS